jgi:hypothetical protein
MEMRIVREAIWQAWTFPTCCAIPRTSRRSSASWCPAFEGGVRDDAGRGRSHLGDGFVWADTGPFAPLSLVCT